MDMQDRDFAIGHQTSVPPWQRAIARLVLVTFTTGVIGCGGGAAQEAQTTTTVTAVDAVPTTLPPATYPPPPTQPPQPPPTPPSTIPAQAPEQLSKQELRDLVAPVALYPDVVLSSLLPATTYPEQLHDAAEYVGQAEVIDRIPDDRGWDGSVVGLLQFPDVIRWLDGNPAWTDQMGQAVTYQQGDVLDAIQDYRQAVKAAGNLQSNQYQKVRAAPNEDIYIEPARPDIVYVPSYDPVIATQPQPAVVAESPGINPWIAFGGGAVVGALGAWALYSIFDDDNDHNTYNYYGGGGRRRIRGYDNYYYARGRRPGTVVWAPRNRQPYRRVDGWQRPRRLQYAAPVARPGKRPAALRPPTKRVGAPAPYATDLKRDQRKGNRQGGQNAQMQGQAPPLTNKQQRQQQKQLQQQQQREQQMQRKAARQAEGGGGGGGKGKQGQGQGQGQQRNGGRQKSQQQQRRQAQPKQMETEQPRQERRQERQQQDGQRERRNDQPKQQRQQERVNDGGGQKHGGGGGGGEKRGGGGGGGGKGGGGGGGNKKKNKNGND